MENKFEEQDTLRKTGRRLAREELFKLVFQSELLKEDIKEIFNNYLNKEESLNTGKNFEFLKKYIEGISMCYSDIKKTIDEKMENWNFERIGTVERSLLIISVYELLKEDVPAEIVANESIELGKEYGDTKTYEFINGVLAKIIITK